MEDKETPEGTQIPEGKETQEGTQIPEGKETQEGSETPKGTQIPGRKAVTHPQQPRTLDLAALKALSHPMRLQLLEMLSRYGEQTASGLAVRIGESSGSTSYHLRQLAKHGLVREVEGKGSGRERWWERPPGAIAVTPPQTGNNRSAVTAARIVARQFEQNRSQALEDFLRFGDEQLGDQWMNAAVLNTSNLVLNADQLEEISQRVVAYLGNIVEEYRGHGGPGSLPVQFHFNAFPLIDPAHDNPHH